MLSAIIFALAFVLLAGASADAAPVEVRFDVRSNSNLSLFDENQNLVDQAPLSGYMYALIDGGHWTIDRFHFEVVGGLFGGLVSDIWFKLPYTDPYTLELVSTNHGIQTGNTLLFEEGACPACTDFMGIYNADAQSAGLGVFYEPFASPLGFLVFEEPGVPPRILLEGTLTVQDPLGFPFTIDADLFLEGWRPASAVPEPGSLALMGTGLMALGALGIKTFRRTRR